MSRNHRKKICDEYRHRRRGKCTGTGEKTGSSEKYPSNDIEGSTKTKGTDYGKRGGRCTDGPIERFCV